MGIKFITIEPPTFGHAIRVESIDLYNNKHLSDGKFTRFHNVERMSNSKFNFFILPYNNGLSYAKKMCPYVAG